MDLWMCTFADFISPIQLLNREKHVDAGSMMLQPEVIAIVNENKGSTLQTKHGSLKNHRMKGTHL